MFYTYLIQPSVLSISLYLLFSFLGDLIVTRTRIPSNVIEEIKEYHTVMKFAGLQTLSEGFSLEKSNHFWTFFLNVHWLLPGPKPPKLCKSFSITSQRVRGQRTTFTEVKFSPMTSLVVGSYDYGWTNQCLPRRLSPGERIYNDLAVKHPLSNERIWLPSYRYSFN